MSSIDYGFGTMANRHPETGIRYSVVACNDLDQDLVQELWFGSGATDLTYLAAYEEAKKEAEQEYETLLEEAEIAASEIDPNMSALEREEFIEKWFDRMDWEFDKERFVERKLEQFSDMYESDEPEIEGEWEGVKYLISWLGGAPLVWISEGPVGYARRLCSPCVPGAADISSPDDYRLEGEPESEGFEYECYCPPRDWWPSDQSDLFKG